MSEMKDDMFKLGGYHSASEALAAIVLVVLKKYPTTNISRILQTCNKGRRALIRFYDRAASRRIAVAREEEWIFCATLYGELLLEAYKQQDRSNAARRLSPSQLLEEFKRKFRFNFSTNDATSTDRANLDRVFKLFAPARNRTRDY